jgi:hypothetical protein
VGARDVEMVEQIHDVADHVHPVRAGVSWLLAESVAAMVERDDAELPGESGDDPGRSPVELAVHSEAAEQDNRRA